MSHTFHLPVMGTSFSIDSPIRLARYGISSVISLVDDQLIEDVHKFYAEKLGEEYTPINKHDEDWRAKRITAYLNLVNKVVNKQFEELKASSFEAGSEITKYFELLPDTSCLKITYKKMLVSQDAATKTALQSELRNQITAGSINVNIMTKLDRLNLSKDGSPLPDEFSDASAALRGYAQSDCINSGIVLSAGFNRRLYSYAEEFKDFYPQADGSLKKQIILKVSDYRSAITQGKFLAKKGIWISEFRVESGLNCGGHVFPGSGNLMGPVLKEFKEKRSELISQLWETYKEVLEKKNIPLPKKPFTFRVTAQGGIGTAKEDQFLMRYYNLSTTGWGSPFLLVPEATQVDKETLEKLASATEKDIYLSDVSPLNVGFNNLRNSFSEIKKDLLISKGTPGSACFLGHLASNTEFTKNPVCVASRTYQRLKIEALKAMGLPQKEYEKEIARVTAKACLCAELGDGFYKNAKIEKMTDLAPAVCPGPNIAYFNRAVTLKEMIDHIYGRTDIMPFKNRPHMFIKEILFNIEQLIKQVKELGDTPTDKDLASVKSFQTNLQEGIEYYKTMISQITEESIEARTKILEQLTETENQIANAI